MDSYRWAMKRERRRWTGRVAADIPEGPTGQPAHAAGATWSAVHVVVLPEVGRVFMTVPLPSQMMLEAAEGHAKRAVRLRKQLPNQTERVKWTMPGHELRFSNEKLLYDCLQDSMAAVLLGHTALDNFLNEAIPADFEWTDDKGQVVGRQQIEGHWGLEKKLDLILPRVTGKESVQTGLPETWARCQDIKALRDLIGHTHYEATYTGPHDDPESSLYSRLLACDLEVLVQVADDVRDCYVATRSTEQK